MAVFKCKMCGAQLDVTNASIATCDYCGSTQTLPNLNDDKIERLYERANTFRQGNEFDKAMAIYEEILNDKPEDSESYWSIILCKYGVQYVEDPQTRKRIPTVNRAQFTSIFDDINYKSAIEYADNSQRAIYEQEAEAINQIQKGILDISSKEEPFDVFICYKETDQMGRRTHESVYANELYHELKEEGFKVFFARITLEDKLGSAYEPYIFAALNSAKVMVVIGTSSENFNAVWVKNEWSRYLNLIKSGEKKVLIPAYKDMDAYDLPKEFSHLQAQDMSKLGFMPDLIRGIKKIVGKKQSQPAAQTIVQQVQQAPQANVSALLERASLFLEDSDFENADIYCEKVLDADPKNAQAYIYKLLVQTRITNEGELGEQKKALDNYTAYKNALRFADEETASRLIAYNNQIKERLAEEKAIADEKKRIEVEAAREKAQKLNDLNYLSAERTKAQRRLNELNKQAIHLDKVIKREEKLTFSSRENVKALIAFGFSCVIMPVAAIISFISAILIGTGYGALLGVPAIIATDVVLFLLALACLKPYKRSLSWAFLAAITLFIPVLIFGIIVVTVSGKEKQKKHFGILANAKKRRSEIPAEISVARSEIGKYISAIQQRQRGIMVEVPKPYVPEEN